MTVNRSAFVPPPKVTSAVVHIVPGEQPAGRRSESHGAADRGGVRPAPQDAAIEPEGDARRARRGRRRSASTRSGAPKRSASRNGSRWRERSAPSSTSGFAAPWPTATVGPRLIAADSCAICGQPLRRRSSAASAGSPARARSRPARPSLRPGRRSRRDRSARAQRLVGHADRLAEQMLLLGDARDVDEGAAVARIDGKRGLEQVLGLLELAGRDQRLAPAAEARPTWARSGRRRAGWRPARQARGRQARSSRTRGKGLHQTLHSTVAPSMVGAAARRKSRRCRSWPGVSSRPAPSERPRGNGRLLTNPR